MEIKGIKYIGPIFDGSGYAQANRGNILILHDLGIPITLSPLSFEGVHPELGEDGKLLESLIDKEIDYNIVYMHMTPEFYSNHREEDKINVGHIYWETTKLHPDWLPYINENLSLLFVGCTWNQEVCRDSGITIPTAVIPYGINSDTFNDIEPYKIAGIPDENYIFYSIFQWCYDEKTRVLTKDGFKYFKDLLYTDEIATLNLKTEELEYQHPNEIVKFRRKDKMVSLEGSFFDVCVNPDHKMVVKEKNSSEWKLIPLNKLMSKGKSGQTIIPEKYRAKKNCKWLQGKEEILFQLPKLYNKKYPLRKGFSLEISMDVFLEFLGWYLSEGSTYKAKRGYVNTITQSAEKYRPEILNCIKELGFNPFEKGKDVVFHSREMHYYLKQFGKTKDKFIPKWAKNLSSRQIKILLTSLFKGDGSLYENGDWVKYTTTSKQLAEDVQECLLKIGMSGSISKCDPRLNKPGKIGDRKIRGKLLQYTVSVNRKRNEPSMYYAKLEEIDYDGYVYCATVPNHAMFVERNGKVIFSGNTERKHPVALLKAYWYAFQNNEKVALVLKTYRNNYIESERFAVRESVKRMKAVTPMENHPKIYLILDMLSHEEMLGLHARGDCYVSLDRGEGFGLSPFAAGAAGNPIIVTGFGGATEYAKEHNSYLVDYTLTPVHGMPWSSSIKSIVYTSEGYKCISELSENDLVFNKNCVLKKVQKVGFRKLLDDEVMYSLKYMSLYEPLEVTNKHKLYVVENGEKVVKRVSKIEEGDYLLVPKVKQMAAISSLDILDYVDRDNIINIDGKLKYNNNNSKLLIKRHIAVDFDFGRVCGFYLAEGCVYKNKSTTSFTFNIEECDTLVPECVQSLCNVFGIKSHSVKKRDLKNRNGIELTLNNPIVARFMLALFGSGSKTKCPKEFLLTSTNSDFRKCLLDSYWLGDGHVRKFRVVNDKKYFSRECVATTASQNLVLWLRSLLLSLDVLPSITRNVRKDGRVSYVISVNNVIFDEIIGLPSNQRTPCGSDHHYYSYDNNNFAVRVNNIHLLEDFCGDVWSVSVEPDDDEDVEYGGSYILNGVASSNSPWYLGNQLWAEPDVVHGAELMQEVFNNREEAKQKGSILQKEIRENFSWEVIGNKIIKELESM